MPIQNGGVPSRMSPKLTYRADPISPRALNPSAAERGILRGALDGFKATATFEHQPDIRFQVPPSAMLSRETSRPAMQRE